MLKMSILSSIVGVMMLYAGATQMQESISPISQIDEDFVGLKTKISGQVIDLQGHSKGHLFLKVKDKSGGVISVAIFSNIREKLDGEIELLDNIEIVGRVKEYQGELEIIPEGAGEVRHFHSPPVEVGMVDKSRLGESIKVRGIVSEKIEVGGGSLILELCKGEDNLQVFVPYSVAKKSEFPGIKIGDTVEMSGNVQLYEGELELEVDNPLNVGIIGAH